MENRVRRKSDEIDFDLSEVENREPHLNALFVKPTYFRVEEVYDDTTTQMGGVVDGDKAKEQWESLVGMYERYAENVYVLDPDEVWGLLKNSERSETIASPEEMQDIVFCANQSLPFPDERAVVISNMKHDMRKPETAYLEEWYEQNGYRTTELETDANFEGMGDAIWHPGKRLLWGGVGRRTSTEVYDEISEILDVPIVTLEQSPEKGKFHLDVVFSVLDEETVMIYPDSLTDDSLEKIQTLWEDVLEVPEDEVDRNLEEGKGYAGNAHCIDGNNVVIQRGNRKTIRMLEDHGYSVHEVEMTEFLKGGGSVFCMKIMLP